MYIFWCTLPAIWARTRKEKLREHKKWREKASLDIFKPPKYLGEVSNQLFQLLAILRQNYCKSEWSELEIKNKYGVMNT